MHNIKYTLIGFLRKSFIQKKLPQDDFHLRQIKGSDGLTVYMAINLGYIDFKEKKEYPILLRLIFRKHTDIEESTMSGMEFKIRNQMLNIGELAFISRKEREDYRELFFYISRKSTLKVNALDILTREDCLENVELLLSCDKNWVVAEEHLKYVEE